MIGHSSVFALKEGVVCNWQPRHIPECLPSIPNAQRARHTPSRHFPKPASPPRQPVHRCYCCCPAPTSHKVKVLRTALTLLPFLGCRSANLPSVQPRPERRNRPPVASETPAHCCGRWQPATGSPLRISKSPPPHPRFGLTAPICHFQSDLGTWDFLLTDISFPFPPKTKSDQSQTVNQSILTATSRPDRGIFFDAALDHCERELHPQFFHPYNTTRRTSGDWLLSPIPHPRRPKTKKNPQSWSPPSTPVLPALELPRQTGDQPLLEATTVHHQRTTATARISPRLSKR